MLPVGADASPPRDTLNTTRDGWDRREFLQLVGAPQAGLLDASGCFSPKRLPETPGGEAVTITSLFGQTIITESLKRVVRAGYTDQDDLFAGGMVPITVINWFGDQPFAVCQWTQPKLGIAQPVVLNFDNGIPVDQIAGLKTTH
nr:hypothetical protein [Mycobacterium leprae]